MHVPSYRTINIFLVCALGIVCVRVLLTDRLMWASIVSLHSSFYRHNLRQKFDFIREECGDACDTMIKPTKR